MHCYSATGFTLFVTCLSWCILVKRSSNEDEIAQGYRETIILHSIIYQNGSKVLQLIPVLVVVCQYFVSIKCQKCLNYQLRSMVKSIIIC